MTERKMATIRRIDKIEPIEGADKIVKATVGGWQLVTAIDNGFKEGDLVVYCEIDSWIPTTVAPFLTKPDQYPKVFEGVEGERLKTIRLRGVLSQGLLMPTMGMPYTASIICKQVGDDVSEELGIKKYEAPIPAQLAGEVKGMFPGYVPKTDQERIQNLTAELVEWVRLGYTFEQTEKLDGSSMTAVLMDGEFSVCSRNLELKPNPDNSLYKAAIAQGIEGKMRAFGRNLAIQGELIGNGIQGNKYKLTGQKFYVFDVYDIDAKRYFTPVERKAFVDVYAIEHVPIFKSGMSLADLTVTDLLRIAEAKSVMGDITGPEQEGNVYKCNENAEVSFKVISNSFLLHEK